jgi:hypothetical protein
MCSGSWCLTVARLMLLATTLFTYKSSVNTLSDALIIIEYRHIIICYDYVLQCSGITLELTRLCFLFSV